MTTTKHVSLRGDETWKELKVLAKALLAQARVERRDNRYNELSAAQKRHVDVYINNLASRG